MAGRGGLAAPAADDIAQPDDPPSGESLVIERPTSRRPSGPRRPLPSRRPLLRPLRPPARAGRHRACVARVHALRAGPARLGAARRRADPAGSVPAGRRPALRLRGKPPGRRAAADLGDGCRQLPHRLPARARRRRDRRPRGARQSHHACGPWAPEESTTSCCARPRSSGSASGRASPRAARRARRSLVLADGRASATARTRSRRRPAARSCACNEAPRLQLRLPSLRKPHQRSIHRAWARSARTPPLPCSASVPTRCARGSGASAIPTPRRTQGGHGRFESSS